MVDRNHRTTSLQSEREIHPWVLGDGTINFESAPGENRTPDCCGTNRLAMNLDSTLTDCAILPSHHLRDGASGKQKHKLIFSNTTPKSGLNHIHYMRSWFIVEFRFRFPIEVRFLLSGIKEIIGVIENSISVSLTSEGNDRLSNGIYPRNKRLGPNRTPSISKHVTSNIWITHLLRYRNTVNNFEVNWWLATARLAVAFEFLLWFEVLISF